MRCEFLLCVVAACGRQGGKEERLCDARGLIERDLCGGHVMSERGLMHGHDLVAVEI
jgi:hypothetical protein